jgi:hypothetical protein
MSPVHHRHSSACHCGYRPAQGPGGGLSAINPDVRSPPSWPTAAHSWRRTGRRDQVPMFHFHQRLRKRTTSTRSPGVIGSHNAGYRNRTWPTLRGPCWR